MWGEVPQRLVPLSPVVWARVEGLQARAGQSVWVVVSVLPGARTYRFDRRSATLLMAMRLGAAQPDQVLRFLRLRTTSRTASTRQTHARVDVAHDPSLRLDAPREFP